MTNSFELMADVSSNNGEVDIASYSRAGHVAIAIKATQGTSYINPFHQEQSIVAHEFGLTVIHYHYCGPESGNEQEEINHFRNIYNKAWANGDWTCFDIEVPAFQGSNANNILLKYHEQSKREPVLYADRSDLENKFRHVIIPGGRKWEAEWNANPITTWMKQYTNGIEGPEPHFYSGIGKCDGSIINSGTARRFYLHKIKSRKRK
jgi:Glycosyl hydrolases family 25